jgi:hypothetical protein
MIEEIPLHGIAIPGGIREEAIVDNWSRGVQTSPGTPRPSPINIEIGVVSRRYNKVPVHHPMDDLAIIWQG